MGVGCQTSAFSVNNQRAVHGGGLRGHRPASQTWKKYQGLWGFFLGGGVRRPPAAAAAMLLLLLSDQSLICGDDAEHYARTATINGGNTHKGVMCRQQLRDVTRGRWCTLSPAAVCV